MAQHEGSHTLSAYQSYASSVRFHPTTLPPTVSLLTVFSLLACDLASRPGDTTGLQSYGRWEWHGRIVADRGAGRFRWAARGWRQTPGGVAAALYSTAGNDSPRQVTSPLHQRLDAVK